MKTLITLCSLVVGCLLVTVYLRRNEDEDYKLSQIDGLTKQVNTLEKRIRMGPKPYCLSHPPGRPLTKNERDSNLLYVSHLRSFEIYEARAASTDPVMIAFIDTVLQLKHLRGDSDELME